MNQAQILGSQGNVYNRACIAALCEAWENAFCLLEEAIQNREVSIEWIRQDPDWEETRQDESYKRLIRGCWVINFNYPDGGKPWPARR